MKTKEKALLKIFLLEATRVIMSDPKDLSYDSENAGRTQKEHTTYSQNNKTNLDAEAVMIELAKNIGPNTFIRFEDQYDKNVPTFSISPKVLYQTPHGLYAYPLATKNLVNLIKYRSPTGAPFATTYSHFHIFKADRSKTEILSDKREKIKTKYRVSIDAKKDIKEAIRSTFFLLSPKKTKKKYLNSIESYDIKKKLILEEINIISQQINSISETDEDNLHDFLINSIVKLYQKNCFYNKNKDPKKQKSIFLDRDIINNLSALVYKFYFNYFKEKTEHHRKLFLFKVVKNSIEMLSDVISTINSAPRGQYYSLLLHIIGIDAIDDRNTSLVHVCEPTQFVSHDFDGKSLALIGTYNNIFLSESASSLFRMLKKAADILQLNISTKTDFVDNDLRKLNLPENSFIKILNGQIDLSKIYYTESPEGVSEDIHLRSAFLDISKNLNTTKNIQVKLLEKVKLLNNEETLESVIENLVNNPITDAKVLEYIIKNEETNSNIKQKISNHRNASKETKSIANSFVNTIKRYTKNLIDFL